MKKTLVALMMALGLVAVASAQVKTVTKKVKIDGKTVKQQMYLGYVTEYDANENITKVTGHEYEVVYTYNSDGEIVLAVDNMGNKTTIQYDENGNKAKETNVEFVDGEYVEQTTDYEYNEAGLLVHEKNDVFECWYTYDANGNCIKEKDSTGAVISAVYNQNNQVIEKTLTSKDNAANILYEYDEAGNMVHYVYEEDDVTFEEWYEFDEAGRCIYQQDSRGFCLQQSYDDKGNIYYSRDVDGNCTFYENIYKKGRLIKVNTYFWEDEAKG